MSRYFLVLVLLSILNAAAQATDIAKRDIWHPQYRGLSLAYCTSDKSQCGKAVANQYCEILGYDEAREAIIDYNKGLTNFIDSKLRCKGWECNAFIKIQCIQTIRHQPLAPYYYNKKRFSYPRYNHYRIAWCYKKGSDCGKTSANTFCRMQGYMHSSNYAVDQNIYASRALGSGELCFGRECQGYKYIDCQR